MLTCSDHTQRQGTPQYKRGAAHTNSLLDPDWEHTVPPPRGRVVDFLIPMLKDGDLFQIGLEPREVRTCQDEVTT